MNYLSLNNHVTQAFLATCFVWAMTACGASVIFFAKNLSKKILDGSLGFAGGIMVAASYWSLLAPAIEMSKDDRITWLAPAVGFLAGGFFLWGVDKILPHLHIGLSEEAEGVKTSLQRTQLFILAIILHHIPEGLAVGVAFGAISSGSSSATLPAAIALAIGVGIQSLPEGLAVAMPLRREGLSRLKSFWYGQLSAAVDPIAGVIGALFVLHIKTLMPYALAFAAGAMIFVVVEEVIPESQRSSNTDLATILTILGFTLMMALDVAFS